MHRRFLKSLATVMGAAALVVAPMALLAPSAHADHVLTPDAYAPQSSDDNKEATWVTFLEGEGYTDVVCEKIEPVDDPFEIPEPPEGEVWVLAVVKGGSGEKANELYWNPEPGHFLSHQTAGNSHIILCTGKKPVTSSPPPSSTPPHSTPPVVDTDRVSTGSGANLGLYGAAAALLVGAAAIVAGRRRQGAHR